MQNTEQTHLATFTIRATDDGSELTGIKFTSHHQAHQTLQELGKGGSRHNGLAKNVEAAMIAAGYLVVNPNADLDAVYINSQQYILTGKGFRWAIQMAEKIGDNDAVYLLSQSLKTAKRIVAENTPVATEEIAVTEAEYTPTIEEVKAAHAEAVAAGQPFVAGPLNTIIINFASDHGVKSPEFVREFWNLSRERLAQGRFTSADDKRWAFEQIKAGNFDPSAVFVVYNDLSIDEDRDLVAAHRDTLRGNVAECYPTGDALSRCRELGLVSVCSRKLTEKGLHFIEAVKSN